MKNFAHYLKTEIADLEAEMRASTTYRRIEEAKRLLALYEGDEASQGGTAETAAQPEGDAGAMGEEEAEEEPASSASPSDKDPPGDALSVVGETTVADTVTDDAVVQDGFEADGQAGGMTDGSEGSDLTPFDAGSPAATDHSTDTAPTATGATDTPLPETSAPTDAVPFVPADDPATLVQTDPRLKPDEEAPAPDTGAHDTGAHEAGAASDTDADATTDPVQDETDAAEADTTADHAPHKDGDVIIVPPERPNAPSLSRWRW